MPVIIKRYRNRKLYNTQTKRYITLEEIENLIKQQENIQVIENDSGNDITATTLSQIIFDLEKNQTGVLPLNLLFSLVQSGGKRFDEIRRSIFTSLNFAHHFEAELGRRLNLLIASGNIPQDEGKVLFEKLVSVESKQDSLVDTMEGKISDFLRDRQIPTREDLQLLINRIDDLSQMIDGFQATKADEEETEGNT